MPLEQQLEQHSMHVETGLVLQTADVQGGFIAKQDGRLVVATAAAVTLTCIDKCIMIEFCWHPNLIHIVAVLHQVLGQTGSLKHGPAYTINNLQSTPHKKTWWTRAGTKVRVAQGTGFYTSRAAHRTLKVHFNWLEPCPGACSKACVCLNSPRHSFLEEGTGSLGPAWRGCRRASASNLGSCGRWRWLVAPARTYSALLTGCCTPGPAGAKLVVNSWRLAPWNITPEELQ